ncbi:unnamed protein product [Urochloa humidicola]
MEHQATEKPSDPSDKDLLFAPGCILSRRFKDVDEKPKQVRSWNGWRVVTWSRTVSCSCWHKGSVIDVADISVDKSGLRCETVVEKILHSGFPILSPDADDILYLKSVAKSSDPNGWMIAVDLRRRRVEALGAYSSAMHNPLVKAYCSFTLSTHINMDPGTKVSACCKITDVGSCADDPYNTPTDSCESDNKRPRRPSHGSIILKGPTTMDIHSNSMPQLHSLKANIQILANASSYSDSIFLVLAEPW